MNFEVIWWDFANVPHNKQFKLWDEAAAYELSLVHAGYTTSGILGDASPIPIDDYPF